MAGTSLLSSSIALLPLAFLIVSASAFSDISAAKKNQNVVANNHAYPQEMAYWPIWARWWPWPKKICCKEFAKRNICFKNFDGIFKEMKFLVHCPDEINTKMRLNTRKTGLQEAKSQTLDWRNPETIENSSFDPSKPVMIVTHGYSCSIMEPWLIEMMQVSLQWNDINFIRVGWSGASKTMFYDQAASDTRVVAAEISELIGVMKDLGVDLNNIWMIGHSLGAHLAGFVGRYTRKLSIGKIGRITGLDPAGPSFQGHYASARLDPTDANFVDVIHTNGGTNDTVIWHKEYLGALDPMGHVDYYPNGGNYQPGCKRSESIFTPHFCNHHRAIEIFTEAIRLKAQGGSCQFKAHRCDSYHSYLRMECQDCANGCSIIGPDSFRTRPKTNETNVKMYLSTHYKGKNSDTFCAKPDEFYNFAVKLSGGFDENGGQIFVKFTTTSGETIEQEVTVQKNETLKPNHSYHVLTVKNGNIDVSKISKVQVQYKRVLSLISNGKIVLHSAVLSHAHDYDKNYSESSEFCPDGGKDLELQSHEWVTLTKCH